MSDDDEATILVADDDRLVLATVVAGLRQAGFTVLEADNGDDAILIARRRRPVAPAPLSDAERQRLAELLKS